MIPRNVPVFPKRSPLLVVLDEPMETFADSRSSPSMGSVSSVKSWDDSREEIDKWSVSAGRGDNFLSQKVVEIFKVDDTAMFVPNYCPTLTDYYVVL